MTEEEKKENRFAEILRLQQLPLRMTDGMEELVRLTTWRACGFPMGGERRFIMASSFDTSESMLLT